MLQVWLGPEFGCKGSARQRKIGWHKNSSVAIVVLGKQDTAFLMRLIHASRFFLDSSEKCKTTKLKATEVCQCQKQKSVCEAAMFL